MRAVNYENDRGTRPDDSELIRLDNDNGKEERPGEDSDGDMRTDNDSTGVMCPQ